MKSKVIIREKEYQSISFIEFEFDSEVDSISFARKFVNNVIEKDKYIADVRFERKGDSDNE